ncbi:hypothetical protein L0337_19800 [candidate division KSB1 bacterium]|nr:hypothetical protein [candidate division KSB1 bacterium]
MIGKMTIAILRTTTKNLLHWSQKPFTGKPVSTNRVILRHGESGRLGKLPSILTSRADGAANLNAGVVTPQIDFHVDNRKARRVDSICNQGVLAFGVRLMY